MTTPPRPAPLPLEHTPTPPDLPGTVVLRPDVEDVAGAIAADLLIHALNCTRSFGDFHLALSGGSTPAPLYRRLMTDPAYRHLPWKHTHLWIVDERRVPFDDERSNFGSIRGYFLDHTDIPADNVHPINTNLDDPAADYEHQLRQTLAWREKGHDRLDFVLLGMGADAHTASLFPNSPALDAHDRLAAPNEGDAVTPPPRITMTYKLINASRFIAVMVTGGGKRDTLAAVARAAASPRPPTRDLPILGVSPVGGALRWYIDHDACPPRPGRPG